MARKKAPPAEREALLLRLPPRLKQDITKVARREGINVNDYVTEVLRRDVEDRSAIDDELRKVMDGAVSAATSGLNTLELKLGRRLDRDVRLMAIETLLCTNVTEAVRGMLQPPKEMMFVASLWTMLLQDAERLGLEGPVWEYVRSLGPNSPPPKEDYVSDLSNEITKLKESGVRGEKLDAVESLNVWLGLAVHQHAEAWAEYKRMREEQRQAAKTELYELLADRSAKKRPKK